MWIVPARRHVSVDSVRIHARCAVHVGKMPCVRQSYTDRGVLVPIAMLVGPISNAPQIPVVLPKQHPDPMLYPSELAVRTVIAIRPYTVIPMDSARILVKIQLMCARVIKGVKPEDIVPCAFARPVLL